MKDLFPQPGRYMDTKSPVFLLTPERTFRVITFMEKAAAAVTKEREEESLWWPPDRQRTTLAFYKLSIASELLATERVETNATGMRLQRQNQDRFEVFAFSAACEEMAAVLKATS